MLKKWTVAQLAQEIGVSFQELMILFEECSLVKREWQDEVTIIEKNKVLDLFNKKNEEQCDPALVRKTKRRLVIKVNNARGRSETIQVEVRKLRAYQKPMVCSEKEMPKDDIELELVANVQTEAQALMDQDAQNVSKEENSSTQTELKQEDLKKEEELEKPLPENDLLFADLPCIEEQKMQEVETDGLGLEQTSNSVADPKPPATNTSEKLDGQKSKKPRFNEKSSKPFSRRLGLDLSTLEDLSDEGESPGVFIPSEHLRSKLTRGASGHERKGKKNPASVGNDAASSLRSKKASKQILQQKFTRPVAPVSKTIRVHEGILVQDLAEKLSMKSAALIKELMKLGIMARLNDSVESDVIELLSESVGHQIVVVSQNILEESFLDDQKHESHDQGTEPRAPVVTVMGHVDHGKTSLLDYIRKTRVASLEFGGITQHLGAYRVNLSQGSVVFIDTPGHQAFTMMRARGAKCTDLVVLVVAADDGLMPQTVEAIQHAKAANAPIVVAVTKIDKASANILKIKEELLKYELVCEEWGGDLQVVGVSSVTGEGIEDLLQAILLQAEMMCLTSSRIGVVHGVVLESRMEKGRGCAANILIQKGTLKLGDLVVCGQSYGRVRQMINEEGKEMHCAEPSFPATIYGLTTLPLPGDLLVTTTNDKKAKELTGYRLLQARNQRLREKQQLNQSGWNALTQEPKTSMDSNDHKEEKVLFDVVLKADTYGTLEALKSALIRLNCESIDINVRGYGVGALTESDVALAQASKAFLIAFNVRPDAAARKLLEQEQIKVHFHNIIYEVLESVKAEISGKLSPIKQQLLKGKAEVRAVFRSPKFGAVAGCMIIEGVVTRKQILHVVRDGKVIIEAELDSLRRGKEDALEVRQGMECGIGIKNYSDFQVGDHIEVYDIKEVSRNIFQDEVQ